MTSVSLNAQPIVAPTWNSADEKAEPATPASALVAPTTHGDAPIADPLAKFQSLFGAPPLVHGALYADKGGTAGGPSTAAPAKVLATPTTLQLGDCGPAVRKLQEELNKWRGAQSPKQKPIGEDGVFAEETKRAVEEFQKTNKIPTGKDKIDFTPNGIADVRVQMRLRLENDPSFGKLTDTNKALARDVLTGAGRDSTRYEPLFDLIDDASLGKLMAPVQTQMLQGLKARPLEPKALSDAELVQQYTRLAGDPKFAKGLDPTVQQSCVRLLNVVGRPQAPLPGGDPARQIRTGVDNLAKLVTGADFGKLTSADQQLLLHAVGTRPYDTKLADAVGSMIHSPRFDALRPLEKTALLSQVDNYPDHRSVTNMERMLAKDWFRDQSLGEKQRSLKMIAYLAQNDRGSRTIIDNTLDKLLSEKSNLKLIWDDLNVSDSFFRPKESHTTGMGDHSSGTLSLDIDTLQAGNGKVPGDFYSKHLVLHTVAHEVSHILNKDDTKAATFQHFEQEYRAWAVGFEAENGHWPTNKEAMPRVRQLLTTETGAYADIKGAKGKMHEADQIFQMLQDITGRPVNAGNLDEILNVAPENWINQSQDPEEKEMKQSERMAPVPGHGNVENS